jgi:hypothetical protein
MSIRGTVTLECDSKGCHAEEVIDAEDASIAAGLDRGVSCLFHFGDWLMTTDGNLHCPQCVEKDAK